MLSVSDQALELLAGVVERAAETEEAAVRLVARPEGWVMELDEPQPEDETFEHENRTVLVLDVHAAERLEGSTLEVQRTAEGPRLRLR